MFNISPLIKKLGFTIFLSFFLLLIAVGQTYSIAVCSGNSFSFVVPSAANGTTYTWSNPSAVPSGVISNASAQSTAQTTVSQTLNSSSTANAIVTYNVTTSTNTTFQLQVTVKPIPVLNNIAAAFTSCSGSSFNYTPSSNTIGTSFSWSRAAVTGISNSAGQGTSLGLINEVLTNTTSNPIPVAYNFTEIANGCTNNQTLTVTVNAVPALSSTLTPAAICSGAIFNYSPTAFSSNTSYTWTRFAVTGINNGISNSGTNNPNEQLTNSTLIPITVTYSFTLYNSITTCSNTQFVQVIVNPVPSATNQIVSSCSGNNFIASPTSVPVNTLYTWSAPAITGSIIGGSANVVAQTFIGQTLTNNGAVAGTALYTVTPSTYGCVGSNFFVTVNVSTTNATAVLNSSLTPPDICSGTLFSYSPTSISAGTSFSWKRFFAAGIGNAPASGTGNINEVLVNSTTLPVTAYYVISLNNLSGCSNTQQVAVIVNPATSLSSSPTPTPICSNTLFSYLPTSNTLGSTFNWSRSAVAGISNTATSGINDPSEVLINTTTLPVIVTYNYYLSTANGCSNNQTVTIQINPTPILTSALNPPAICSGNAFNYTPLSNIIGTQFSWSRSIVPSISNGAATGTNNPAETLVNTDIISVAVPYNFILTANGCTSFPTVIISVNPTPKVSNLVSRSCSNSLFTVNPTNIPIGTQYTWTAPISNPVAALSGGAAQAIPQNDISQTLINQTLNTASALYTITPVAGLCSGASFTVNVVIDPVAFIANQILAPVCSGKPFSYLPTGVPSGTMYTWSNPLLQPVLSLTGSSAQAISQSVISQTLISKNNIADSAIYTITPATNGCVGTTFTLTAIISPVPVINNISDTICSGSFFSIFPSSVPVNTQYTWLNPLNYPFGSNIGGKAQVTPVSVISQSLINTTNNAAQTVYTISPVAGSCAGNNFTIIETVGVPLPFISNQNTTICSGTSFDATPLSATLGTTYTWGIPVATPVGMVSGISAKASAQIRVSQTLVNLGNVIDTVVYLVIPFNTGCVGNIFSATVKILPSPKATIGGQTIVCRNPFDTLSVSFTGTAPWSFTYIDSTGLNIKTGITTTPYTWLVPAIPNLPTRDFIVTNVKDFACLNTLDTFYFHQRINPLPVGKIISLHGIYICDNIKDTLFVSSSAADTLSYQWLLNRVLIPGATTDSISTLQPGNYNAQLTNQYGCVDTAALPMGLILMTKPNLQIAYDSYCINKMIRFTNQTDTTNTGSIQWFWNMGDSTTRTSFNTTNTYYTGGSRHIKLMATQLNCPANPVFADTTINIAFPIDAFRMPSVSAYKGVPKPIAARVVNGYRYQWVPSWGIDYPDSALVNFNYANTQQYFVNLISPAGCVTPDTVLVRVFDNNLLEILVPKSFTPNADGVNDVLYPYLAGIQSFHYFKVYNRYGKLLFESKDPDVGWNGTFNGQQQPMSIYLWIAEGIAADGSLVQKKGETLLLR